MLKTEQILNAKFTPVSKGTYSAEEVDEFLKTVAQSYEQSLSEKNELIRKMGILADKVESYRNDEEAIKLALLDAHKMAENINKTSNDKAAVIIDEAEKKAADITAQAEYKASQTIEEAREQAKSIVDNAKTAVASLTDRAQSETEKAIVSAQEKAAEIIADAENQRAAIIGNSKASYEYYSKEIEKIKTETAEFKAAVEKLCAEQLKLVDTIPEITVEAAPVIEETEAVEEIEEAPAVEEPVIEEEVEEESVAEAPAEEEIEEAEEEEPAFEEPVEEGIEAEEEIEAEAEPEEDEALDGDLDDLLDFLNSESSDAPEIASDIDDLLPEAVDLDIGEFGDEDEIVENDNEDFKFDLGSIDDIVFDDDKEDGEEKDEDITSLFDSLFND